MKHWIGNLLDWMFLIDEGDRYGDLERQLMLSSRAIAAGFRASGLVFAPS